MTPTPDRDAWRAPIVWVGDPNSNSTAVWGNLTVRLEDCSDGWWSYDVLDRRMHPLYGGSITDCTGPQARARAEMYARRHLAPPAQPKQVRAPALTPIPDWVGPLIDHLIDAEEWAVLDAIPRAVVHARATADAEEWARLVAGDPAPAPAAPAPAPAPAPPVIRRRRKGAL